MAPLTTSASHPSMLLLIPVLLACSAFAVDKLELGGDQLYREILRDETVLRLKELGQVSDGEGFLERTFLSPASIRATKIIISWMKDAGLMTWVDQMGNIHGRFEPANSTGEALLFGSHMDTVIDAGMYDGSLGIICAISALKVFKATGKLQRLTRPVEVIAFSDEEGVRFQTTFLGSAAVAGTLPESILQVSDKSGTTVQDVLKLNSFEATAAALSQAKYSPKSVGSYVEVHLEQGPVLEALRYPLGVVKGIAGQTRLKGIKLWFFAPTVILSKQHYVVMSECFANYPHIKIAIFSGAQNKEEKDETITRVSLMSTPPPERVAAKTFVSAFSKERALSAIKFELQRSFLCYTSNKSGFGSAQAKEMLDHLESVLANEPVSVKRGKFIVEVKPQFGAGNVLGRHRWCPCSHPLCSEC